MSRESQPTTRRALLATAAASAAALAARAALPSAVSAHDPDDLQVGVVNVANGTTQMNGNTLDVDVFKVVGANANTGSAVVAVGSHAPAIRAYSGQDAAVYGISGSDTDAAVQDDTKSTGVYGYTPTSPDPANIIASGVWGDSPDIGVAGTGGIGVAGSGHIGVEGDGFGSGGRGVLGYAADPGTVGVLAYAGATDRTALAVTGRTSFSRSGRTTIAAGQYAKTISLAGVTPGTLILAVLGSNRSGRWVRAVVPTAGRFTIYLNTTVTATSYLVWWVLS